MKVAGLLLTGGASKRMGRDKATIMIGGETMAARVAGVMREIADPVLVVGHEAGTGLETVDDPRQGPLVAVACGRRALLERGLDVPALVLACDLPFVNAALLKLLVEKSGDADAVVPVLDGLDQSLCAWYSTRALDVATKTADQGSRAMKALLGRIIVRSISSDECLASDLGKSNLRDVDNPQDLCPS